MIDQEYSVTRTRATWKPRVSEGDLPFFRCRTCGRIALSVDEGAPARFEGGGRNPTARLPYDEAPAPVPQCCGRPMVRLPFQAPEDASAELGLDYRIVGGFNNNAVECRWNPYAESKVRWAALKTFTGTQTKYVLPKKRPPLLFALADEDAYAYCDESPCLECTFMCKRGFVLYVAVERPAEDGKPAIERLVIVRLPLTRMSPYWESRPEAAPSRT